MAYSSLDSPLLVEPNNISYSPVLQDPHVSSEDAKIFVNIPQFPLVPLSITNKPPITLALSDFSFPRCAPGPGLTSQTGPLPLHSPDQSSPQQLLQEHTCSQGEQPSLPTLCTLYLSLS